jgi:hypothetical protein
MRSFRSVPVALASVALILGALTAVAPAAHSSEPAPVVSAKVKCVNTAGFARYSKSGSCKRTERLDRKTCAKGGSCVVGDVGPGRGRVFYSARTQQPWGRYLEAAPNTWNSREGDPNVTWCSNVVDSIPGTQGTGLGDGKANTAAMLGVCTIDAAVLASAYRGGGKADWYLPSRDELRTLFLREKKVGPFIFHGYWSSSESAPDQAWIQDFYLEAVLQTTEKGYANYVRPIRAF